MESKKAQAGVHHLHVNKPLFILLILTAIVKKNSLESFLLAKPDNPESFESI